MVKILVGNAQIYVEINSHEKIVCLFGCSISRFLEGYFIAK